METTPTIYLTKAGNGRTFKDGGTEVWIDQYGEEYFRDKRIGSKTRGRFYDKYPDKKGANIIPDFDILLEMTVKVFRPVSQYKEK